MNKKKQAYFNGFKAAIFSLSNDCPESSKKYSDNWLKGWKNGKIAIMHAQTKIMASVKAC